MANRIDTTFSRLRESSKKAFVAYVCGGDPNFEKSLEILHALADAGADIIELGVPFSDPIADGIVNQMAADRALNAGMSTPRILDLIRAFRQTHETPIVLFTYLNPIYAYGYQKFHVDAAAAGADGILLLDLPPSEEEKNADFVGGEPLHHISLIAPTTPDDRQKSLAQSSQGFIYALSRTGVTGGHAAPSEAIGELVANISAHTDTPICVGFGISNPEHAKMVAEKADGVIVGSAIVKTVELNADAPDVAQKLKDFVTPLIKATHEA
ncbi:tryptophan synthase subunit alpha [Akkermansiaceae bacterium]|nr:tryptophan synthase subunit alpha [Akkermansiaceae bacterium]MDB4541393.1 tryptophan synthase subunit alpha [Akkermansiaceae bacterium]